MPAKITPLTSLIDLTIFLSVMFLVRTYQLESLGFWGNALQRTIITVGVATLLLRYRGQSWSDLGLRKPGNFLRMAGIVVITLLGTVISIIIFEAFLRDMIWPEMVSSDGESSLFDDIQKSVSIFVSVMLFVWIESLLEELQDRGFSLNRFETLFSKIPLAAILAVLFQAAIFGFRHTYDFSPRSVTTGLIGLVFGIIYITTGRNLWPLIMAHIILNTMSMVD